MLARTIQLTAPNTRNLYGRSGVFGFPRTNCRPNGKGIFTDASFNCNRCQNEPISFMPWVQGDVFYFQTNFADNHHADETNPTDSFAPTAAVSSSTSFRAELNYANGSSQILNEFSVGNMVAWNGENSYQIIIVDTGLALFDDLDCWELKISSLDVDGNPVDFMSTQTFKKAICPEDTCVIKSVYKKFDCLDNYYGEPVAYAGSKIIFNNQMRFWGLVAEIGMSSNASFEFSSSSGIRSSILHRFNTTRWFPPYQRRLIQNLLDSNQFTIDRSAFRRPAYTIEGGLFKIPLEEACIISNIC